MADTTNAPVQQSEPGAPVSKGRAGFLSTTTGRVVVGAVAVFALLALAGAIVAMFFSGGVSGLLSSGSAAVTSTTATSSVAATTAAAAVAAPVQEPAQKPLAASFTFRNVFAPTVKPPVPAEHRHRRQQQLHERIDGLARHAVSHRHRVD